MEPSALVAIAGLLGPESKPSQVVISGDPKQLGPIVRSPVALAMGLGASYNSINLYEFFEINIFCRRLFFGSADGLD